MHAGDAASPGLTVLSICTEGRRARTSTPSSPWGSSESCGHSRPLNGFPSWRYGNPIRHPSSASREKNNNNKAEQPAGAATGVNHTPPWVKCIYSPPRRNCSSWFTTVAFWMCSISFSIMKLWSLWPLWCSVLWRLEKLKSHKLEVSDRKLLSLLNASRARMLILAHTLL